MIPELSIIHLFLDYNVWKEHNNSVQVKDFPKDLQGVARTLYSFHNETPNINITTGDLANLYFASNPPNREYMQEMFSALENVDVSPDTVYELIKGIRINNLMRELSITAYEVAEGRKQYKDAQILFEALKEEPKANTEDFEFVSTNLEELVNGAITKPGLRWRLNTLNRMLGSLRAGDFGFIFARPETGKTTFLASEITFMAQQASGPVLWFNNEEVGDKVMLRCVQAHFGLTLIELMRDLSGYQQRFKEEFDGKFLLLDRATITQTAVEKACEKYKPSLIVFDQIDKIQTAASDREDLRLGALYQWARELAKTYAPTIGVCQADGTGEGVKWLTMSHVANAKTAKQAEADWILGIGKVNDVGYDSLRFLHMSKNKLMGDEDTDSALRHGRMEVLIEPTIARYRDL